MKGYETRKVASLSCPASRSIDKPRTRKLTCVQPDIFLLHGEDVAAIMKLRFADRKGSGRPHDIGGLEERLLLLLIIYRCYLAQNFYSLLFGADKSTISRSLKRIEKPTLRVPGVTKSIKVTEEDAHALLIQAIRFQLWLQKQAHYSISHLVVL
jgi:hypothetical protein